MQKVGIHNKMSKCVNCWLSVHNTFVTISDYFSLLILAYDLHVEWSPMENIFVVFCFAELNTTLTQTLRHTRRIEWNNTLSLHSNLFVSLCFALFCFLFSIFQHDECAAADASLCKDFCCLKIFKMFSMEICDGRCAISFKNVWLCWVYGFA